MRKLLDLTVIIGTICFFSACGDDSESGVDKDSGTDASVEFKVATPVMAPAPGAYDSDQNIAIATTTDGASIHYTTTLGTVASPPADPADPTTSDTLYSGPIPVQDHNTVRKIKAIAVTSGAEDSDIAVGTYTILHTGALDYAASLVDGVGNVDGLNAPWYVTVSPDGKNVYVTGDSDDSIVVFNRNQDTGALTFAEAFFDGVEEVTGIVSAWRATVSPDGKNVYVAGAGSDSVAVFSRNEDTGALTFVQAIFDGDDGGTVTGLSSPAQVVVSPDGKHVYVNGHSSDSLVLFDRNQDTGALTFNTAVFDDAGGVNGLDGT